MNALLVHPELPDTFWCFKHALKFVRKKAGAPPLGLLTVAAMLATSGQPLYVWSVGADDLQSYAHDVAGALATLQQRTGDVQSRATAAGILGLARTQEASALLAAVADPRRTVSQAAGEALGRIADSRTTSDLLLALQSPISWVQRSAATALGMMRAEAAVAPVA